MKELFPKKYIIKVLPAEDCSPEFYPDTDLQEGVKADGYMIVGFKDRKPHFETMYGVSIVNIKEWIVKREQAAQIIRQACALAEGELRAMEINKEKKDDNGVTLSFENQKLTKEVIDKILGRDREE